MLASTGCTVFGGRRAVVLAADAPCANLVPSTWAEGVAHTPDPAPAPPAPAAPAATAPESARTDYFRSMYELALGELRKWTSFAVSEAQNVENANGRTRDSVAIIRGCETRDAAAVHRAGR
jgi:hypothetical protein